MFGTSVVVTVLFYSDLILTFRLIRTASWYVRYVLEYDFFTHAKMIYIV